MNATVTRSLGAGRSAFPKTEAGTMVGAATAAPAALTNWRLLILRMIDLLLPGG
jgi:hypothetical protein